MDRRRGGDFDRPGKAAETKQGHHILRIMPVGQLGPINASQRLPRRIAGTARDQNLLFERPPIVLCIRNLLSDYFGDRGRDGLANGCGRDRSTAL